MLSFVSKISKFHEQYCFWILLRQETLLTATWAQILARTVDAPTWQEGLCPLACITDRAGRIVFVTCG